MRKLRVNDLSNDHRGTDGNKFRVKQTSQSVAKKPAAVGALGFDLKIAGLDEKGGHHHHHHQYKGKGQRIHSGRGKFYDDNYDWYADDKEFFE